jgi:hypothetical protein
LEVGYDNGNVRSMTNFVMTIVFAPTASPWREQIAFKWIAKLNQQSDGKSTEVNLRRDFSEDDDEKGGADDGHKTAGETVEEDGEGGVDEDISEENAAEKKVAVIANGLDGLGVAFLAFGSSIAQNLLGENRVWIEIDGGDSRIYFEIGSIEGHQAQVQSRKESGEAQTDEDDADLRPQR